VALNGDTGKALGGDVDGRREDLPGNLRETVFGVQCFRGTFDTAAELVIGAAAGERGGYACLCNVHVLETAQRDERVLSALAGARFVFPDGAPVAWVQRVAGAGPAERVGGPDLMERVLRDGRPVGLRHAFYGSTESVLDRLRAIVEQRYPGVQIVSAIAPPFGPRSEEDILRDLDALRAAQPDVAWIALGAPRQELWSAQYASLLEPALLVCVGAAFEFLAGTKPRAPRWMRRSGLEWFHRLATEPQRLGGRYLTTNARFLRRAGVGVVRHALGRERPWS
jgi:N-acetylglucosaminyldiphosphoundecaprenol N-acetyl-beta-D-mannosaminyltransferase